MSTKRILAFTGIRSDYDLMSLIYKEMNNRHSFEIGLIVSGAHLSEEYGYTIKEIEKDGIPIVSKIESLINSNSKSSRLLSLAILLQNVIHDVKRFEPDAIIIVGDREEVMVGSLIGSYLRIPVIHFFGGDHASDGNVDNLVRHAASKLANIHFVINDQFKKRLIKMGEEPFRIFNFGSPALDKFNSTVYMTKDDVLRNLKCENFKNYVVVIFHPILGEEKEAGKYFNEILEVLKNKKIKAFVSYPNVDAGNKNIIDEIEKNIEDKNFFFYKNLDRTLFINLLRNCDFLIGNSSLGLFEAPLIRKGVVNVGNRQKGRMSSGNVIFVDQGIKNIEAGIDKVKSSDFKQSLQNMQLMYGDGHSVKKIVDCIESMDLESYLIKDKDPLEMEEY